MKNNSAFKAIGSWILFGTLFIIFVALAGIVAFVLQPNLNGISGILLGLMCATPLAFNLFAKFRRDENNKWFKTYLLPTLIFPFLILIFLGWTAFEQRPEYVFRVFVVDPIPNGVSNIQAYDISAGFDQEVVIAFETIPDAIDQITEINSLELDDDPYNLDRNDIPFEYFPNVNGNQDWVFYSKYDRENISWWLLWVNAEKTQAFFRYVGG